MLPISFSFSVLMFSLVGGASQLSFLGQHQRLTSRSDLTSNNGNGFDSVLVNRTNVSMFSTPSASTASARTSFFTFDDTTGTTATAASTANITASVLNCTHQTPTLVPSPIASVSSATLSSSANVSLSLSLFPSRTRTVTASSTRTSNRSDFTSTQSPVLSNSIMPTLPSTQSSNNGTNPTPASKFNDGDLLTTSLHAVCKRSESCFPAPTTMRTHSASSGNRNLQVTGHDNGLSNGSNGKVTGMSDGATTLTSEVDDGPSASYSNSIESSLTDDRDPLSTEVQTSGTSNTIAAVIAESGLGDPPHQTNLVNSPTTNSPPSQNHNKHLSLIIGIAVGLTIFLCIVCAIAFWLFKKRRPSRFRFDEKLPLDFSKIGHTPREKFSFNSPLGSDRREVIIPTFRADGKPLHQMHDPTQVSPVQSNALVITDGDDRYFHGIALCE